MIAVRFRQDPQHHPLYVLAVAPGAGIRSLADLRGKRIAFSPGQVQGEIVLRSLEAAHLTTHDVKLVELPSTSGDVYISALVGGLIDVAPIGAGVVARHYVDSYGAQGARLIPHSATRDDLTDLYVRTETLEDPGKAAALRAYVRLWVQAQTWIATHHDEFARLYYVGREGLSLADARYTEQASGEPDIPRDWSAAIALEQASVDLMAKESGHRPFDAATLFDRRFEGLGADALADDRPAGRSQAVSLAQR
jgi:sulfonate transport system substrate-binding protein